MSAARDPTTGLFGLSADISSYFRWNPLALGRCAQINKSWAAWVKNYWKAFYEQTWKISLSSHIDAQEACKQRWKADGHFIQRRWGYYPSIQLVPRRALAFSAQLFIKGESHLLVQQEKGFGGWSGSQLCNIHTRKPVNISWKKPFDITTQSGSLIGGITKNNEALIWDLEKEQEVGYFPIKEAYKIFLYKAAGKDCLFVEAKESDYQFIDLETKEVSSSPWVSLYCKSALVTKYGATDSYFIGEGIKKVTIYRLEKSGMTLIDSIPDVERHVVIDESSSGPYLLCSFKTHTELRKLDAPSQVRLRYSENLSGFDNYFIASWEGSEKLIICSQKSSNEPLHLKVWDLATQQVYLEKKVHSAALAREEATGKLMLQGVIFLRAEPCLIGLTIQPTLVFINLQRGSWDSTTTTWQFSIKKFWLFPTTDLQENLPAVVLQTDGHNSYDYDTLSICTFKDPSHPTFPSRLKTQALLKNLRFGLAAMMLVTSSLSLWRLSHLHFRSGFGYLSLFATTALARELLKTPRMHNFFHNFLYPEN